MKEDTSPAISVIMSVYNSSPYLKEAVDSILRQSFRDFEFLITDDCSTDGSRKILNDYLLKDNRIILILNDKNEGLTVNLNRMITKARGKYIARMDSDDISMPDRFEKEHNFMESNPHVGLLGSHSRIIKTGSRDKILKRSSEHEEIRTALLFENIITHSTVFFRNSLLKELDMNYNTGFRIIQDYELWSRLVNKTEFRILPDVLVQYRMTDTNLCAVTSHKQNYRENFLKTIYKYQFDSIGFKYTEDQIDTHICIGYKTKNSSPEILEASESWLKSLSEQNENTKRFIPVIFNKYISMYWFKICTKSTNLGLSVLYKYYRSSLKKGYNPGPVLISRFLIKCLIKH
ncbi:MAG TPA: glycosyltransferase family 2 protein [Clostridiales bacterium]|nr:glycosyltransferase family 2 protein [Clostridiales bacterium]HQP69986.1 glycosyltransferase family 2 protein [Clostridiales bacterium]